MKVENKIEDLNNTSENKSKYWNLGNERDISVNSFLLIEKEIDFR